MRLKNSPDSARGEISARYIDFWLGKRLIPGF
jgi:hypothetical protein